MDGVREADGSVSQYDDVPSPATRSRACSPSSSPSTGRTSRSVRSSKARRGRSGSPRRRRSRCGTAISRSTPARGTSTSASTTITRAATPRSPRVRRVARAAFFRTDGGTCVPTSWGLRLWNGRGEQMITIFFPSPFYDHDDRRAAARARLEPDRAVGGRSARGGRRAARSCGADARVAVVRGSSLLVTARVSSRSRSSSRRVAALEDAASARPAEGATGVVEGRIYIERAKPNDRRTRRSPASASSSCRARRSSSISSRR